MYKQIFLLRPFIFRHSFILQNPSNMSKRKARLLLSKYGNYIMGNCRKRLSVESCCTNLNFTYTKSPPQSHLSRVTEVYLLHIAANVRLFCEEHPEVVVALNSPPVETKWKEYAEATFEAPPTPSKRSTALRSAVS